jgi:type IV pilus assembly protein PilZ
MTGCHDSRPPGSATETRAASRAAATWLVDCEGEETFLYACINKVSELGIFVQTLDPLAVGTELTLSFCPAGVSEPFTLRGRVQWVNELRPDGDDINPGMGIQFVDLEPGERERLVSVIKTIAYLHDELYEGN